MKEEDGKKILIRAFHGNPQDAAEKANHYLEGLRNRDTMIKEVEQTTTTSGQFGVIITLLIKVLVCLCIIYMIV